MFSIHFQKHEKYCVFISIPKRFSLWFQKNARSCLQTKPSLTWVYIVIEWVSVTNIIYGSQFWRLKTLVLRCWDLTAFWFTDCSFLAVSSLIRKGKTALCAFFSRACACVLSHSNYIQLFVTLWTVACQVPLSMGFSRQKYWSVLQCPPPGDFPQGSNQHLLCISCICRRVFYDWCHMGSPMYLIYQSSTPMI